MTVKNIFLILKLQTVMLKIATLVKNQINSSFVNLVLMYQMNHHVYHNSLIYHNIILSTIININHLKYSWMTCTVTIRLKIIIMTFKIIVDLTTL